MARPSSIARRVYTLVFIWLVCVCTRPLSSSSHSSIFTQSSPVPSAHKNNWAVLVCSSRYWFNYRHIANTLSFYHIVKQMGIPDSKIIMMLADDMACNPRNPFPGHVYSNRKKGGSDLYSSGVEVDYRGEDVSTENIISLLTGRHSSDVPRSKRLLTDAESNILVYMTGHGGDGFLKVNDHEVISSHDIADAFQQMHIQQRYKEILFISDTCEAGTLNHQIYSPNILGIASSKKGEHSFSHHSDQELGLSVIDRLTYFTIEYFEKAVIHSSASTASSDADSRGKTKKRAGGKRGKETGEKTVSDLLKTLRSKRLMSTVEVRDRLYERDTRDALLSDFFSAVIDVTPMNHRYQLDKHPHQSSVPSSPSSSPPSPPPPPPLSASMKGKNGNEEAGSSSNSSAWDGDTDHCDQTIFTFGTAVTAQVHAYIRDLSQHIHDQYDMTCEGGSVWVLLALCIVFAYACDVCM